MAEQGQSSKFARRGDVGAHQPKHRSRNFRLINACTHRQTVVSGCRAVLLQLWGMQPVSHFLRVSGMNGTSLSPSCPMWLCCYRKGADKTCPVTVLEKARGTGRMLNEADTVVCIQTVIKSLLRFPLVPFFPFCFTSWVWSLQEKSQNPLFYSCLVAQGDKNFLVLK